MAVDALDIRQVSHAYGDRTALQDVSLRVPAGSFVALLGPNGSGKTTLFRILCALIRPDAGSVEVCGHDVTERPAEIRSCLGVVFQHVALDADLTVIENLRHHAALHGVRSADARRAATALLPRMGLEDRVHDRVKTLSGGQARRADLARVLMHTPRILLLDEPTSGLDPAGRRDFWRAVRWLRSSHGTTVIVATHLLEEAEISDRACFMSHGRVVADGSPAALKAELGEETLWLEAEEPEELADRILAHFGVEVRVLGGSVQISNAQAHNLLSRIYDAFPARITSATVRRPTLEDVYLVHTGSSLADRLGAGMEVGDAVDLSD